MGHTRPSRQDALTHTRVAASASDRVTEEIEPHLFEVAEVMEARNVSIMFFNEDGTYQFEGVAKTAEQLVDYYADLVG